MSPATLFSSDQLSRIVAETIPSDIAESHVVVGTVDSNGAQVVASFKRFKSAGGFNWELQAAARHDWTGEDSVGARVLLKW